MTKNENKVNSWVKIWICIAMLLPSLLLAKVLQEFKEACRDGALARICFKVVDDAGLPVSDAKVEAFFDMMDRSQGRRVIGTTDTNGIYVAAAKTGGNLEIEVSRKGYYDTRTELCFIAMGQEREVRDGKWQPWGMKEKVIIRPVKEPKALKCPSSDWKLTKALNEWIGFDLEKYDYVQPYGKGVVCDFEVKFDWDGLFGSKHNGMALSLRFNDEFSGAYYVDRSLYSSFTGVYSANDKALYEKEYRYYWYPLRDARGQKIGGEGMKFNPQKGLVVRSRCLTDSQGNLISARYSLIESLEFSCSRNKEAALRFFGTFNPTPNDTNLEAKQ